MSVSNKMISRNLWKQRIGYGAADFASNLVWQMISLYLLYFYTDVMLLNVKSISLMFIVTRCIDALLDLFTGYLIDHTNTRWGRSRPFFLYGAIPFAIFAILAFSVPNLSHTGKLVYAYITYICLMFIYGVVNIPLSSILPSLTADINERTMLTTSRKFFAFLGSALVSSSTLGMVAFFGKGDEAKGFKIVMIIFAVIGSLLLLFTFATVKERVKIIDQPKVSVKESVKSLSKNRPWKIFALNAIFMWTANFLENGALIYYYSYNVGDKTLVSKIATIISMVPIIVNFSVPILAKKLGKRNLFVIASIIEVFGLIVVLIGGINRSIIITGAFIIGAGQGIKNSIYFSIQADPIDYGEWKTGINTAGIMSSVNGFIGKCSQAISGGLSGLLLSYGAYKANSEVQSTKALLVIKSMYIYIPVVLVILSIITMLFYNLDKEYPKIKEELEKRNKEVEV